MSTPLKVLVADDERPARSLLIALMKGYDDVEVVGEATDGADAIEKIELLRPDLVLLDLQMPEVNGLDVVRLVRRDRLPLVAFVTAYEEHAVKAFELNAVDYLLKPVDGARLRETLNRAMERAERTELREEATHAVQVAADTLFVRQPLRWIPIRRREETLLVAVDRIAAIVADGELLHIHTIEREKHTITFRLKDLEARLATDEWLRLGRGTLARLDMIERVNSMPGGTSIATLRNGMELAVSRLQSRLLRDRLLRL